MLAVKGYYDGKDIKLLEKIEAQPNQKVIITVVDELVDEHGNTIMKLNSAINDPEELAKKAYSKKIPKTFKHVSLFILI